VNPRLLIFIASFIVGSAFAQQAASPAVDATAAMDETRALLQQWATTQRLIASERGDWENGKAMLQGRIQLLKISVEETEKKIAEAKAKLEDVKKRTAEAEAEKAQTKEASDALLAKAPELETGVKSLFARVPGVIQEKVKVLHDRIPKEGADLKNITAAERFQNVLGILNELGKANNELTTLPEIHDIGEGKKAEVKVVYVGLGQGYFVNSAGSIGGLGLPSDKGWTWTTDAAIAPKMREVVEVMKKTVAPKLVELPAEIR
jgi:seryl-tRNA synthetase